MARRKIHERFTDRIIKSESGCWIWIGYKNRAGYGVIHYSDGHVMAHRESYRIFCGELVDGLDVMHSCDNPGCVNPDHLSLGTRRENLLDAKAKGRNAKGEKHGRSKLTEKQALEIRLSDLPSREAAGMYGVSVAQINNIRSGKKWAHLFEGVVP